MKLYRKMKRRRVRHNLNRKRKKTGPDSGVSPVIVEYGNMGKVQLSRYWLYPLSASAFKKQAEKG